MAPPASTALVTCTIVAGESLSSAANLSQGVPRILIVSPDWNYAGGLSMQISIDGVTYFDVFDDDGKEYMTPALTPGVAYRITDLTEFAVYLKFRSGSRENPVAQVANRQFTIVMSL